MPGVNLDNQRLAEVRPMVGSEGRTALHRPDFGGLLSAVAEGGNKIKGAFDDRKEQQAALAIVDESIIQQQGPASPESTTFQPDPADEAAGARVTSAEEATGVRLDAGDKTALGYAAQVGMRLNNAQTSEPTGERKFNLLRTRELRKLIADRPHLAKEFRSLVYGDNNFLTAALDSTEKNAALQNKARHETISRARDNAYQAGYTNVINMDDETFVSWFEQSDYAADIKALSDTKKEADYYTALYNKGTSINAEDTRRMVLKGKPGLVLSTMGQFEAIRANPTLDPASKARAIEQVVLSKRVEIQTAMPWLSATDITTQFKDVLEDIPNTYRLLSSEGPEKAANETRLAIVQSATNLRLEAKYGKSSVEFVTRTLGTLAPTGILANFDTTKDNPFIQKFFATLAAEENGDNPPAPQLSKRTEREIAEQTAQEASFIQKMLGGFDKLDANSRKATASMVVSAINHPDNRRSDAGMDRLMVLMASPQFKALAESPEWKATVDGAADRAVGVYLRNLDQAVRSTIGPLEGKVTLKLDDVGVLTFVPDAGVQPKDRDALARLQNKLRASIMANANLNGQTPAEATKDFYDAYLAR